MNDLNKEYLRANYLLIKTFSSKDKSSVELVENKLDDKLYIKKILKNYNLKVYKTLQSLDLNFFPRIYEVIQDQNDLIIIEEYIKGQTLEDILKEYGSIEINLSLYYILSLCDSLHKLHSLNPPLIHRDIKPSNLIITSNGILKLIDFDASRLHNEFENKDTFVLGTAGYASPEQYGFSQTDCRSDIYSIGILFNTLLTGKHPRDSVLFGPLGEIIKKCTKLSPDERYSSLVELKNELLRFQWQSSNVANTNKQPLDKKPSSKYNLAYYLPPGFRHLKFYFMLPATLWYIILVYGFCNQFGSGNISLILSDTSLSISLLLITFLLGNYLNVKSHLPLAKSNNKSVRIWGLFLYCFVLLFILYPFFKQS